MSKRIPGFLLAILAVLSTAYVTPAYAVSTDVVITHVQAGVTGAAAKEFVALYNTSDSEINLSDWCLFNKAEVPFACFSSGGPGAAIILPAQSSAIIVSQPLAMDHVGTSFSFVYDPTHTTTGSLVGSNDTVKLVDAVGIERDRVGWTSSVPSGMLRHRTGFPIYADTDTADDWQTIAAGELPIDQTALVETLLDVCSNIDGQQLVIPDGMRLDESGRCIEITSPDGTDPDIIITEVLPNVAGNDQGGEFIELYNRTNQAVDLSGFILEVGVSTVKRVTIPEGTVIAPAEYLAFYNSSLGFSLVNTIGRVTLTNREGRALAQVPDYESPKDDMAWAYIDGTWQYTNRPTPGSENIISVEATKPSASSSPSPVPCAPDQYRHPETNRCRRIVVPTAPTACKAGQYRSAETGRCRTIAVAAAPAACKEGQERHPETNRCRTIRAMTPADYGVLSATQESQPDQWYVIGAIGLGLLMAIGYAIWEWRQDLRRLGGRLWQFASRRR